MLDLMERETGGRDVNFLSCEYFVAIYRAGSIRKAAGEQAKILNYIMEHWTEMKPAIFGKELKEFLGHTPFQVLMGGLLGISVGLLGAWLWT